MEKSKLKNKIICYFLTCIIFIISPYTYTQDIFSLKDDLKITDKELSQDSSKWEKGTIVNIGFNRVGLYNWSSGGQNSMSINSLINSYLNYKSNTTTWNNQLSIAFGVLKTGYGNDVPWLKNDDRIEVTSKYGRRTSFKWDYSILFNFRTQFTYGYNSTEEFNQGAYFSSFLAPAFPLLALGMNFNGSNNLSCFLSPATIKSTIVNNDSLSSAGVFGVTPGKKIRVEAGGYVNLLYKKENLFNIKALNFKTNLTLFSNYINDPSNIDVTWETLTSLKLRKLFSLTFSTYLLYDHDIKLARFNKDGSPIYLTNENGEPYLDEQNKPIQKKGAITQFKEVLSLGLMFTF
jgi:hypothetical protein